MKDFIRKFDPHSKSFTKDFINSTYAERFDFYNSLSKGQIVSLLEKLVFPKEKE